MEDAHPSGTKGRQGTLVNARVADDHATLRGKLLTPPHEGGHGVGNRLTASCGGKLVHRVLDCVDKPEAVLPEPIQDHHLLTNVEARLQSVDRLSDPAVEIVKRQLGRVEEPSRADPGIRWRLANEQHPQPVGPIARSKLLVPRISGPTSTHPGQARWR